MDRVICKTMHRSADQRLLSLEHSNRRCIFLCQPGESRNLRMSHSVRHQDLFALTVVDESLGFAKSQRDLIPRRTADRAERCNVAVGCQWIDSSGGVAKI